MVMGKHNDHAGWPYNLNPGVNKQT